MVHRNHLSYLSLILIGVIAGALIFSQLNKSTQPVAYNMPKYQNNTVSAADRPLKSLRDLNNAYIEIAKAVNPTVITVFTEKIFRIQRQYSENPFWNSPFEDFFNYQPQQPQEQEYRQRGLGSGVIVSKDGYILTNNHVIAEADTIFIRLMNDEMISAKVIGADPKTDIALLKVETTDLPAIPMGNSDSLSVGAWVLAIGSPLSENLAHTVTSGIVSAKGRSNVGLAEFEDFIQTDAAINPGNSGGALIDLDGKLVGINAAIASQNGGFQGIGFAVPINMARRVMDSILQYGTVIRGWLGAHFQEIDRRMAIALGIHMTDGALVADVLRNSPASRAGIQEGDVITEFNNKKILNAVQLRNDIASTAPGTNVTIKIIRENKEISTTAVLGSLQANAISPETEKKLESLFGLKVAPFNEEMAKKYNLEKSLKGVIITALDRTGAARRSGLNEGDLIISINRQELTNIEEFNDLIQNLKHGDTALFRIIRGNRSYYVAFTL
jgi:serine protease Do